MSPPAARADADPYDAVRAAEKAVFALEEEAGIAAEADRARDVFGYDVHSEAPFGSLASKRERHDAQYFEHEAAARRTRVLYFDVTDQDVRRRFIAASRNVSIRRHSAATGAVARARLAVDAAVRDGVRFAVPSLSKARCTRHSSGPRGIGETPAWLWR